jgi:TolA-binding protein
MRTGLSLIVLLVLVGSARADAIWISSGGAGGGGAAGAGANALKLDGVKITAIAQGKVQFVAGGGRESVRDVQQIARIQIDDEPALSAAEEALANGKFDAATDGYRKTLDTTAKPWLKQWSAARLVQSATRANRFDAAVTGYVALLLIDPQQASAYKPALPEAKSTYLTTAINDVNAALARAELTAAQKQSLQSFLLELQRARGDKQAAAQTAEQILQSGAASGADPGAGAALARLRLQTAAAALETKDFAKVVSDISANAAVFVEPRDQATALFYLAEARAGLAAQKNDVPSWQDAALAYMRVVAHFEEAEGAPYVARSLLKTAEIQEKLNDPASARTLYEQVVKQYPADPAATAAAAGAQRLKAKP